VVGFEHVIEAAPFTDAEKTKLRECLNNETAEHKRNILRRELQKVLVGASEDSLSQIATRVRQNDFVYAATGMPSTPQAAFSNAAMQNAFIQHSSAQMALQEWEKQAKMAAAMYGQQTPLPSYNDVFGKT